MVLEASFDHHRSVTTTENPAQLVVDGVERCLDLAATWPAWDGLLIHGEETGEGAGNEWTPLKALRRINDHLIDHLHEVEALLAGAEAMPDQWRGRFVTLDADWPPVTEADIDEARSRLCRLARSYLLRYATAGPAEWDAPRGKAWTLREIAEHVSHVDLYAQEIGRLT
jgi:hypothetical protein